MSTDGQGGASSPEETQAHPKVTSDGGAGTTSADAKPGSAKAGGARSATAAMREGAMARTAQGRDLAARKARALRGATAGLASGSAAGATAGRAAAGGSGAAGASGARTGGPRPGGTARTSSPSGQRAPRRGGPRRVRLTAQRIDPWSVLKISFLVSVALGIAGVVMVAVLWTVLSGMNVFSIVSDFLTQITSGESGGPSFDLMDYLGLGRVVSLAAVIGVLNVFLLTALATLTAFLYNICAALVGGAQVTLSDE